MYVCAHVHTMNAPKKPEEGVQSLDPELGCLWATLWVQETKYKVFLTDLASLLVFSLNMKSQNKVTI